MPDLTIHYQYLASGIFANRLHKSNINFASELNKNYNIMNKTFKIEVDCANCANLIEEAAKKVNGVTNLSISFMTQKMKITFEESANTEIVMAEILKIAKRIEPDFEII